MVEIFYTEQDYKANLSKVKDVNLIDSLIDAFPLHDLDILFSLRLQIFNFQYHRFETAYPGHDTMDFEKDWWSREADKIKECMKIIDYNDSISYVEKVKLKSKLNNYSDMIENHMKPPGLKLSPGRQALDSMATLIELFNVDSEQKIGELKDGTVIFSKRLFEIGVDDFSLIFNKEFEKEKNRFGAPHSDQAEQFFRRLLIERLSQYVTSYKSHFTPDKQDMQLLLIADCFVEYLNDPFKVIGAHQKKDGPNKTIIITEDAQRTLIVFFNGPLKTDPNKELFKKVISGTKQDQKVVINMPLSNVVLAFNLLRQNGFIKGMSPHELGNWISANISPKSKKDIPVSTMEKYLKNLIVPALQKTRFAPITDLFKSKGAK